MKKNYRRYPWNTIRLAILEEYYPTYPKKIVLEKLAPFSWHAIQTQASERGIRRTWYDGRSKKLRGVKRKSSTAWLPSVWQHHRQMCQKYFGIDIENP